MSQADRQAQPPLRIIALMALALVAPLIAGWILWIAPVSALGADRAALAARDFAVLWQAGRLATEGALGAVYDPALLTRALRDTFGAGMPSQIFPYPPPALLLAWPLAAPTLSVGLAIYTFGGVALLWLALRLAGWRRLACAAVLLSPAVAENALAGQNGALTAAALVGGLSLLDRRPLAAGALLGMLVMKPQLGLLLPVCLVARGHWRALLTAVAVAAALAMGSALVFGADVWSLYLLRARPAISTYFEAAWTANGGQLLFSSVFMAARSLGATLTDAYGFQAAASLLCAWMVWRVWRGPSDAPTRLSVALVATALASPWVHSYDMVIVAVAVAGLLARAARDASPVRMPVLATGWIFPGLPSLFALPNVVAPATLAALLMVAVEQSLAIRPRYGNKLGSMRSIRFLGLFGVSLAAMLLGASSAACALEVERACDAAAAHAEQAMNVPAGVLSAVGTVESARGGGPLGAAPWPWTINAAGRGAHFATKTEAIAAVFTLMARGIPTIDVGCFQIDILYHAGVFRSLEDAFDPERNAQEAVKILDQSRRNGADWPTAVAHYHSANPEHGLPYLQRVRAALPNARARGNAADLLHGLEARMSARSSMDRANAPDEVRLPKVIYAMPEVGVAGVPQTLQVARPRSRIAPLRTARSPP